MPISQFATKSGTVIQVLLKYHNEKLYTKG